jgi:hypothetical protein
MQVRTGDGGPSARTSFLLSPLSALGPPEDTERGTPAADARGFREGPYRRRLRDHVIVVENGKERSLPRGEFVNTRVLELEDVAALFVVGVSIEAGGLLRASEPDRGLSTLSNVGGSLSRLQRAGLIEAQRDGNAWIVGWGKRALDIAAKAGVAIATA